MRRYILLLFALACIYHTAAPADPFISEQQSGSWSTLHPWIDVASLRSVFFIDDQTGWAIETSGSYRVIKTIDGGTSWSKLNIGSNSEIMRDLHFIDSDRGWVVGNAGVFRTADGGLNWTPQTSDIADPRLSVVQFTNADSGWAAGYIWTDSDYGIITRTADGGQNWGTQTFTAVDKISSIFFINSQTGWAIGDINAFPSSSQIYKTVDGGLNWTELTVIEDRHYSLFFIDAKNGWCTGYNTILKTTDGGATWSEQSDNSWNRLTSIVFTDPTHGCAVGERSFDGNILVSDDGGATWRQTVVNKSLSSVYFVDTQTGWAVGDNGTILKTTDAGVNWSNLAFLTRNRLWSIYALSPDHFWAGSGYYAGESGAIFRSDDGGTGWRTSTVADDNSVYDIQFIDSQTGWACLRKNGMLKTTNGGQSWQRIAPAGWTKALHAVFFLDAKTGWAAGGGSISRILCKSADGGNTWTSQTIPGGEALMDVYFITPDSGWAVGMNSTVLRTVDGGATWEVKNSGVPSDIWLNCVVFQNSRVGFIGSNTALNGVICKTTDGGESWTHYLTSSGIVEDICFIDEQTGWAVGSRGPSAKSISGDGGIDLSGGGVKVWATGDGGDTWSDHPLSIGSSLWSVVFTDLNNGWAVGSNGYVLKYTDTLPIPAAPTNLTATVTGSNTIRLNWFDNANNETGFYLYRSDGVSGAYRLIATLAPNTTMYDDGGLASGQSFWYRICAFNATGKSAKSLDASAALVPPPAAPAALSPANDASNQSINPTLSWQGVADAVTYHLQVATDINFNEKIVDDSTLYTTSKAIGPLQYYTTYYWRVRAKNMGGTGAWSSPTRRFTTILAAPVPVSPDDGATNQPLALSFIWHKTSGADTYHLQVDDDQYFIYPRVIDDDGLTDTTRMAASLNSSTLYYWRVRAKNAGGSSDWSSPAWQFTTVMAKPAAPALSAPADGSVAQALEPTLKWNAGAGVSSYHLQVSTNGEFNQLVFDDSTLTGTSKKIGPLSYDTRYYWHVRAKNTAGISDWSDPAWSFTTVMMAPAMPALVSPANGAADLSSTVTFSWSPAERAQFYHLQLAMDDAFTQLFYEKSDLTGISAEVGPLAGMTTYYWRILARNTGGSSNWTGPWSFTTRQLPPLPPVLASPADKSSDVSTTVVLSWNPAASAIDYHLQVSLFADFSQLMVDDSLLTDTQQSVGNLSPATGYYWHVRARNTAGYSDYSQTWYFFTAGTAWSIKQIGESNDLTTVYFVNESTGWIGGHFSTLYKTTDGGEQWQKITLSRSIFIRSIYFFDQQVGICTGIGGKIFRSDDGGMNWTSINHPAGSSIWLEAIKFVDNNTGWIAGDEGTILKTVDGGLTWVKQTSNTTARLEDIDFVDANTGWVVGIDGTVLYTDNGGDTWAPQAIGSDYWLLSVDLVDANTGWVAGLSGAVYKTMDGGATWMDQSSWEYDSIEDIHFIDANTGYAAGWSGSLWKTANGGQAWEKMESGTDKDLQSIFFIHSSGWIVGNEGVILQKKSGEPVTVEDDRAIEMQPPREMALLQNYPNPFNSATTFAFHLSERTFVELSIYNLWGQKVADIADGYFDAGRHTIHWSAKDLASGEYFYRLRTPAFVETKKMVYLR
ncbi:T9SS type A sorting domain-containing protein [candidate division KSB1 bacterium]|nr:T9SS type A sorting domain-containing protein [candidate division KSB1 bacterium]